MIKDLDQTAQTNILVRVFAVLICVDDTFSWHDHMKSLVAYFYTSFYFSSVISQKTRYGIKSITPVLSVN